VFRYSRPNPIDAHRCAQRILLELEHGADIAMVQIGWARQHPNNTHLHSAQLKTSGFTNVQGAY